MRGAGVFVAVFVGILGVLLGGGGREVGAAELLSNGEFESWAEGEPAGWFVSGGSVSQGEGRSGNGARLVGSGGSVTLGQRVAIQGGGTIWTSAWVQSGGTGTASLRLQFYTAGLTMLGSPVAESGVALGGWRAISVSVGSPSNAAYAQVSVVLTGLAGGPVDATVDSATLEGASPVPTATPSATPTPRPPTVAVATATALPDSPIATTTVAPGYGGLLVNGGFEQADDGRPRGWSKYGGTMGISRTAFDGKQAATLSADSSSTYWLHQVVRVTGGQWYEASGYARMAAGNGDSFIRLSWYEASDGGGSAMKTADSGLVTGREWSAVSTGPVRAPEGASSVRVRLMLRSRGAGTAAFDLLAFYRVDEPPEDEEGAEDDEPEEDDGSPGATPRATNTPRASGGGTASGGGGGSPTFRPEGAADGELRISEVMSDPPETGADSGYEWVEVVNVGSSPVSLAGWRIGDARASDVLPAAVVEPGEYVVIAGKSAVFGEGVKAVRVSDGTIGNGLNNDGDAVSLTNLAGAVVDAMSYGGDVSIFDPAPEAAKAGQTLGVIAPGGEPAADNWAATQRPTPGGANVFAQQAAASGRAPGTGGKASATAATPGSGEPSSTVPLVITAVMAGAGVTVAGSQLWKRRDVVLDRLRRDEGGN